MPLEKLTVSTPSGNYPVYLGRDAFSELIRFLSAHKGRIVVITGRRVASIFSSYRAKLEKKLGRRIVFLLLPDGENHKNLETLNTVYTRLLRNQLNRDTLIVAWGGGVIGDLAGFAAATFLRGVPFVQVPTTLLAMVDASVGGKVAINHPLGKNMIGQFYQPRAVFMDLRFLSTLPSREMNNGFAEIAKHGVIMDNTLFHDLEKHIEDFRNLRGNSLIRIIKRSCEIKAEVVARDERETKHRMILNYGHTFGHALETVTDYTYFRHGEAVVHGMLAAGELGRQINDFSERDWDRQRRLLGRIGLRKMPSLDSSALLRAMKRDKKTSGGTLRLIVPRHIGRVDILDDVPEKEVRRAIKGMIS